MEMTRDVKIENTLRYFKNENATAEMLSREIEALQKRAKTHANNADWCKNYLAAIVKPREKLEFGIGKISWRESTSANILDAGKLPAEYQRVIPERREPDKIAIKEALKNGVDVPGAELVISQNIQLK
jgi:predicted deacetylase